MTEWCGIKEEGSIMTRPVILFSAAALILIAYGCGDDTSHPLQQQGAFTLDMFPRAIGDAWTYSIHDTITGRRDTLDVFVYDTTLLFGKEPGTVWLLVDTDYVAHLDFVTNVGDSLKFYRDRCGVPYRVLVFPFDFGSGWRFDYSGGSDSSLVAAKEIVDLPYGQVQAYRVDAETYPVIMDEIRYSSAWLTPEIGLVRAEYTEGFRVITKHEIWELIDFHLADENVSLR
jgi:hypothetical protein